jgi:hypothetical protein
MRSEFVALENIDADVDTNSARETIGENIKIAANSAKLL